MLSVYIAAISSVSIKTQASREGGVYWVHRLIDPWSAPRRPGGCGGAQFRCPLEIRTHCWSKPDASIQRICGTSSLLTIVPSPMSFGASTAFSPSTWATHAEPAAGRHEQVRPSQRDANLAYRALEQIHNLLWEVRRRRKVVRLIAGER